MHATTHAWLLRYMLLRWWTPTVVYARHVCIHTYAHMHAITHAWLLHHLLLRWWTPTVMWSVRQFSKC